VKEQYFGDIHDYAKFGVLRILANAGSLRVGICWMRTSWDGRTDGNQVRYLLKQRTHGRFDRDLYDFLRIHARTCDLKTIENKGIILGAVYHSDLLMPNRETFFREMFNRLMHCDLIFFDPDNGFEIKSKPMGGKDSCKFLYWNELTETFQRGFSVMVYQHFPRVNRRIYISKVAEDIKRHCGEVGSVHCFWTGHAGLFLISQTKHKDHVQSFLGRFAESAWSKRRIQVCEL
jgi:hypothetical protein